jgi:hypothetical protein
LQPKPVAPDKAPLPAVPFSFAGRLAELGSVQPDIDIADLQRDIEARKLLGGAEAEQGIWPSSTTAVSDLDTAPPAQRQQPDAAALPVAGKTPMVALPAPAPEPVQAVMPVPLQSAANGDTATPAPSAALTASNTAAPADAPVKRAPARIKKKKIGWATSIFQDLFGN